MWFYFFAELSQDNIIIMSIPPKEPNKFPIPKERPQRRDLPKKLPDFIPRPDRTEKQDRPDIQRGWKRPKR